MDALLDSLPIRCGHFLLESGYHTDLWSELDALFLTPGALALHVERLAALLRPSAVSAICGPLLGGAFLAQALATHLGVRFISPNRAVPFSLLSETDDPSSSSVTPRFA
jgi:orotate phosphoribosyltransferase